MARRLRGPALAIASAGVLLNLLAGCSGSNDEKDPPPPDPVVGQLTVDLLVPSGFDANEEVAMWRLAVVPSADPDSPIAAVEVPAGTPIRLDGLAPVSDVFLRLESFDGAGARLGHGRTEALDLTTEDATATLYFAPPDSFHAVDGETAGRASPAVMRLSDGKILIAGGLESDLEGATDTQLYDPHTNAVEDLPDLLEPQRFPAAFSPAADVLVLAGGWDDGGSALDVVQVFRYFPGVASTWSYGPDLAEERADAVAVALGDGRTLLVSGTNGGGFLATTELFAWDGTQGSWTPGPAGRARAGTVAVSLGGGRALILGGRDAGGAIDRIQIFEADTLVNVTGMNLQNGRASPAVLTLSPTSWIIAGGLNGSGNPRDTSEILSWSEAQQETAVAAGPALPNSRWRGGSGLTGDGRLVLVGGETGSSPFDLLGLDETLRWTGSSLAPFGPSPGPTTSCAVFPLGDGTTVFVTDDDVYRYNPP